MKNITLFHMKSPALVSPRPSRVYRSPTLPLAHQHAGRQPHNLWTPLPLIWEADLGSVLGHRGGTGAGETEERARRRLLVERFSSLRSLTTTTQTPQEVVTITSSVSWSLRPSSIHREFPARPFLK